MPNSCALLSPWFLVINLFLFLVTAVAAVFFAFSGYLQSLGLDPATSGLILGGDALAALVLQPLISLLMHPGTARRWLAGGAVVLSAALLMLAQVSTAPWLLVARLLQGAGFIAVLSALISLFVCVVPTEASGRAFGWSSLVRLLPYAAIPWMFDTFSISSAAFPDVLALCALVALAPLLLLLLPVSQLQESAESQDAPGFAGLMASLRTSSVALVLVSALLFFCAYSAIFFFLKAFGQSVGLRNADLFFTVATLVMMVLRLSAGWLFDRINKRWLSCLGMLAAALSYALLSLPEARTMFLGLAVLTGLGWGVSMPLQAALMFDVSTPHARALNQNLLMLMMQGGFFIGPFAGGLVIGHFGYPALFVGIALMTLLAGAVLLAVRAPSAAAEVV